MYNSDVWTLGRKESIPERIKGNSEIVEWEAEPYWGKWSFYHLGLCHAHGNELLKLSFHLNDNGDNF